MLEETQSSAAAVGAPAHAPLTVRVREVSMDFGTGSKAVDRASFDLSLGRFLTILGPSGSGKTTLLRMIAGFQRPTSGHILIGGKPVDAVPPDRRSIGMAEFQEAIERVIAGPERRSRLITPKEKEIVAYHEAGHAVIRCHRQTRHRHCSKVPRIPVQSESA